MSVFSMLRKDPHLRSALLFAAAGVVAVIVAAVLIVNSQGTYARVDAVVSDVVTSLGGVNDDATTSVFVDYTVNGQKYEHILVDGSDISMKLGKTITVEYDVNNPARIRGKFSKYVPYGLLLIGLLLAIGFSRSFVIQVRQQRELEQRRGE